MLACKRSSGNSNWRKSIKPPNKNVRKPWKSFKTSRHKSSKSVVRWHPITPKRKLDCTPLLRVPWHLPCKVRFCSPEPWNPILELPTCRSNCRFEIKDYICIFLHTSFQNDSWTRDYEALCTTATWQDTNMFLLTCVNAHMCLFAT